MTIPSPALAAKPSASIYRHPGFLAFISARLMAVFATQIQAVVVAWQVYDLTRDPLALAYVGLAQFLPMLCLLLPAGDLIDRFNRKAILASSWAVGALCSGALWWLSGITTADVGGVTGIYAVLVLFGCSRAFSGPALQSLLPQVVPREQLAAAIAANSMLMRAASIGGPLLGGVLYALGGGRLTYALCFVCFALGTVLLTLAAGLGAAYGTAWVAAGTWWLALLPEAHACARLQDWAGRRYAAETPAQGFPAWVDGAGQFRGFGVDPLQIAGLGLTPTPKIVAFWVEGGYARELVEGLGFTVPAGTEQGLPLRSPHLEPAPHAPR